MAPEASMRFLFSTLTLVFSLMTTQAQASEAYCEQSPYSADCSSSEAYCEANPYASSCSK
jgi:hypothetical protein